MRTPHDKPLPLLRGGLCFWAFMVLLACCRPLAAAPNHPDDEYRFISSADRIKLGDSEEQVTGKVEPTWTRVQTKAFMKRYPFKGLVPYTNTSVVAEWEAGRPSTGGWPSVLFVVFSDTRKTNVVDVLQSDGNSVQPLVDGLYNRNLLGVKKGDSIEKVYSLLGRKDCEYLKGPDGKWRVKFTYLGSGGKFFQLEADAATGLVQRVSNVTLD